ncbi:hypothetical protein HDU76_011499 [Blyttiomyces sp. JEL0837]|nr:hypothetical protein HDU76_011499 [Blyttiomyces sp. JEL0837]
MHPRRRRKTTPAELAILESYYAKNKLPNLNERIALSKQIGMSVREIQVWFQNRRQERRKGRGGYRGVHSTRNIAMMPKTGFNGYKAVHGGVVHERRVGKSADSGDSGVECEGIVVVQKERLVTKDKPCDNDIFRMDVLLGSRICGHGHGSEKVSREAGLTTTTATTTTTTTNDECHSDAAGRKRKKTEEDPDSGSVSTTADDVLDSNQVLKTSSSSIKSGGAIPHHVSSPPPTRFQHHHVEKDGTSQPPTKMTLLAFRPTPQDPVIMLRVPALVNPTSSSTSSTSTSNPNSSGTPILVKTIPVPGTEDKDGTQEHISYVTVKGVVAEQQRGGGSSLHGQPGAVVESKPSGNNSTTFTVRWKGSSSASKAKLDSTSKQDLKGNVIPTILTPSPTVSPLTSHAYIFNPSSQSSTATTIPQQSNTTPTPTSTRYHETRYYPTTASTVAHTYSYSQHHPSTYTPSSSHPSPIYQYTYQYNGSGTPPASHGPVYTTYTYHPQAHLQPQHHQQHQHQHHQQQAKVTYVYDYSGRDSNSGHHAGYVRTTSAPTVYQNQRSY